MNVWLRARGLHDTLAKHNQPPVDLWRCSRVDLERALAEAGALASRLTLLRYEDAQTGSAAHRARELTDTVDELCRALAEARAA
jgi:hypothetical protein